MKALLQDALSVDQSVRTNAENTIISLQNNDFALFLQVLMAIFCEEDVQIPPYRIVAGILLKNSLHTKDQTIQHHCEAKWGALGESFRGEVKALVLGNMRSGKLKVALISGGIMGAIARIELPQGSFKDFFELMHAYVREGKETLTRAALESVGLAATHLIEETSYDFASDSKIILSILTQKLVPGENDDIKMDALKCVVSSLEAIEATMDNPSSVDSLLRAITSVVSDDDELTAYAVECVYMIVGLYYMKLEYCFGMLIEFVKGLLGTDSEKVHVQIIEFWSVLAEVEADSGGNLTEQNLFVIMKYLLPRLVKGDGYDDEGWNSHKAATNCVENVSKCIGIDLLDFGPFASFVAAGLDSEDIRYQEAGAIALGSAIHKKISDKGLLAKTLPILVKNIKNEHLRETSLWSLSKICETNFDAVDAGVVLPDMIYNTMHVVQENTKHSIYAAYLVSGMSTYVAGGKNKTWDYENQLSFFYYDILDVVVRAIEIADVKDFKLRRALFTALTDLITSASENVSTILNELLKYLITKSTQCLKYQDNTEQFLVIEDIVSSYIIVIQNIILARTEDKVGEMKDQVLCLFVDVLRSRQSYIHGDVYITLSVLCTPTSYFTLNISKFVSFLVRDLRSTDFYILKAAINLVGDVANSLNQGFLVYSEQLVPELIKCLMSPSIHRDLKPILLSVFGDVALSMGTSFSPYLDMTMHILAQIAGLQRRFSEAFVDLLRKNAVQMVDCVTIALGHHAKVRENLENVVLFIQKVVSEDEDKRCTKDCVNLLGDLLKAFGKEGGLGEKWVCKYLEACIVDNDATITPAAQKSLWLWKSSH